MSLLEELSAQQRVRGLIPGETVEVVSVVMHGDDAAQLVFRKPDGSLGERVLNRAQEGELSLAEKVARPFDAEATAFKLVAEAQRIKLAGLFDPMLAVTTVVAPGGLAEQWQDELFLKFGLRFELFSTDQHRPGESAFGASAFEERPFLIARMDQIARNEDLVAELEQTQ